MKTAPVFLALCALASTALAEDAPLKAGLVEFNGEHIGLVASTLSGDGRYAAGWTVRPKKGKPPVKWEAYGSENDSFLGDYCDNEGYTVSNVIVDLPHHAIAATLQFTDPYYARKGHGSLQIVYGPESGGHRYAIALSDSKWEPNDVVLVDLAAEGAPQFDVRKPLDAAVLKYIHGKRSSKGYVTDYMIVNLPELGLLTGFADANTVRVPFTSCIPKAEGVPNYEDNVVVHITTEKGHPHATAEVPSNTPTFDLTSDDPRIATADKDLNAAYTALRTKLDAAGKARLVAEQRAWIKERDAKVNAVDTSNNEEIFLFNPRIAADRLLLQLTTDRAAALRAR